MKITLNLVKDFVRANIRYYGEEFLDNQPKHLQEQVEYRLSLCKDDCLVADRCKYCGCPPKKKAWANHSCNDGARFPDLMDADSWEKYKETNNIQL